MIAKHLTWTFILTCRRLTLIFFSFFLLEKFYIAFYSSYVSICKDLQKTIVLSSGPFRQVFTFTIQYICNLWWSKSSPFEAILIALCLPSDQWFWSRYYTNNNMIAKYIVLSHIINVVGIRYFAYMYSGTPLDIKKLLVLLYT